MRKAIKLLRAFATRRLVMTFDKIDLRYKNLSWKRIWTWFLAEASYYLKSDRAWSYPTHLQVEPSNECNLRCPLCHVVTDNKPHGFLRLADFKKIVDEIGDYIFVLQFWGWGEPFLNTDFFSMIRYAKAKGIQIVTSTNGHFFERMESVDGLIDSGLDVLIFALDGVDAETYEKYRQRGDFSKVLRGLQLFLRRREERGASHPLLNLRMLVTRDNENQVEQMKDLARELGVDVLSFKTLCSFDSQVKWKSLVPCSREYRRFEYDDDGEPIRIKNRCKKLWNHPVIYRDGTVVICDFHTGQELSLGNAFAEDGRGFSRIWFGEQFRRLRDRFRKGDRSGLRCQDCSLNFADVDRCVSHAFFYGRPPSRRGTAKPRG